MSDFELGFPDKTDREVIIRALRERANTRERLNTIYSDQLDKIDNLEEREKLEGWLDQEQRRAARLRVIAHNLEEQDASSD